MTDAVNKPQHYMLFADGTEAIDIIRKSLTPDEFAGYCKGNVLKYRLRAGKKDALHQDIAKADTYAKMLLDTTPMKVEVTFDASPAPQVPLATPELWPYKY